MSVDSLAALNPRVANINLIYVGDDIKTTGSTNNSTSISTTVSTSAAVSSEVELLARLVEAEAGNESYSGKVAVAEVVLNRVASGQFPNSIQGVIYQPGQFSPVSNGMINKAAAGDSRQAAQQAINGHRNDGSLYFYNPAAVTSRWLDTRPTVKTIGNHVFKK
ncbi:cell wall hydrolase [Peribacillus muralis]